MNLVAYGLVAILLLGGANWWQWSRGESLAKRAETAEQLSNERQAEIDTLHQQAEQTVKALEVLAAKNTTLRSNYEATDRRLRAMSDDGCVRRDHPGDVERMLHEADAEAAAAAARLPGPDAGLRRQDLPGRDPVRPAAAGVGPVVPGGGRGESRGAGG